MRPNAKKGNDIMSPREIIGKAFDWKVVRDLGVPVVFCMVLLGVGTVQSGKLLDAQLAATTANTQLLNQMVQIAAEIRAAELRQDASLATMSATLSRMVDGPQKPAVKPGG